MSCSLNAEDTPEEGWLGNTWALETLLNADDG